MSFDFRPYQPPAIQFLSKRRRAMVKAPAGSGKTIIGAGALHRVYSAKVRTTRPRIGWICNTTEQREQGQAALDLFPMDADFRIVCAQANPDMSDRDVLVVDECHHSLSPLWRGIIDSCPGALWGLTATPFPDDEEAFEELLEMYGGEMHTIERSEVGSSLAHGRVALLADTDQNREEIDEQIKGDLSTMVARSLYVRTAELWEKHWAEFVVLHNLSPFKDAKEAWQEVERRRLSGTVRAFLKAKLADELWPRVAFQVCKDVGIMHNARRNDAIVRTAMTHADESKLILVNNKEHGAMLAERIPGAVVAHSKMGAKKRREAVAALRDGSLGSMIATSLADEGADFPRITVLIMASGGSSSKLAEQRSGRVLRAFQGKQEGLIYDFTDTGHPLMAKQSRKRQQVYRELGYTVEHVNPRQPSLFGVTS